VIPRRPLYLKDPNQPTADWVQLGTGVFASPQRILKQFSLLDDITFSDTGLPTDASGGTGPSVAIERQGRYSWAYLFRRVRNFSPSERKQVDLSVVVYSGRSIDVPTNENSFYGLSPQQPTSLTGSRSLLLAYSGPNRPELRRGHWILDATIFDKSGSVFPQGRFYRVVGVEEGRLTEATDSLPPALIPVGSPTVAVELQTPLAFGPDPDPPPLPPKQNPRIFIVMSNVVEVFTIGEVTQFSRPRLFTDDQEH
jgi:hypothetical protein